jgi:hypothetical protein
MFDFCWKLQAAMGLERRYPQGCKPHFGSQWWTLRWSTLEKVQLARSNNEVADFFRSTWVPDELFFQTIVANSVPSEQISQSNLTFHHFDRQGRPLVFYNDHGDFLAKQPHFFARKISGRATRLRDYLDTLADARTGEKPPPPRAPKILEPFSAFSELIKMGGLPNRRLFGRVKAPTLAEMERSQRAYTVIIAPRTADLQDLWHHFAAQPDTVCYGDLFEPGAIHCGVHAQPHPMYPAKRPALRDMSPAGFLFDIIQSNAGRHVVFSLRIPSTSPILDVLIHDRHCDVVFSRTKALVRRSQSGALDWESELVERLYGDLAWIMKKDGRRIRWMTEPAAEVGRL